MYYLDRSQVIAAVLKEPRDESPTIALLLANQTEDDILVRGMLEGRVRGRVLCLTLSLTFTLTSHLSPSPSPSPFTLTPTLTPIRLRRYA